MDIKEKANRKYIKIQTGIVFLLTFALVVTITWFINQNQVKREKLKAAYTAESTVSRVESQLNRYLAESDMIKRILEKGYTLDEERFNALAGLMQEDQDVIEARELAEDGTVSQIYPMNGNEAAMGLNMLENSARKKEARLAMESGEYTIAGPYELVQGGMGALLFDPAYVTDANGEKKFWGFSILVMNWDNFIETVELDKLEEAGYDYQIWKKDLYTGKKIVIDESEGMNLKSSLEVVCSVPNDTWYFQIMPANGWITSAQTTAGVLISFILTLMAAAAYWQYRIRRYKDILHEKELEKSMLEAKRANEAKTHFLFNMSHDIRTPMNAIIGFSDLLEKHLDDRQRAETYIEKIRHSSSFLLSLINYVLEMARIESGKATLKTETRSLKDLTETLKDVFEPSVEEKNLRYTCELDAKHLYVKCDETKLREILLNVISNSVKYTLEGGSVTVKITEEGAAENLTEGAIKQMAGSSAEDTEKNKKGQKLLYRFIIEDTGIGMSEEYLPHMFEEFTRERSSTESKVIGTGLGLPIVKSLVDLMGGSIEVSSQIGKGTKTTILLPFVIAEKKIPDKQQEQKESEKLLEPLKGKRILLVEDNELNAEIAITILEEGGLKVEWAEDGRKCLEIVQEKPEDYYDLILMDIQMPKMDGYQTTEKIRSLSDRRSRIPIVAMTANAFDEDKKKAYESGMNGHISKPVDIKTIFATLGRILLAKSENL